MFYEAELRLLRQTFHKCRIRTGIAELTRSLAEYTDSELFPFLAERLDISQPLSDLLPMLQPEVLYRLRDPFGCCYLFLLLPELPSRAALAVGPYLPEAVSGERLLELAEAAHVPPARLQELTRCYSNLPILPESSHLFVLLESFCQRLWGSTTLQVEDLDRQSMQVLPPRKQDAAGERTELWNMQVLEQRYSYENELMEAVSKGQIHKAGQLFANMSASFLEQRTADVLRNAKNYCIIMNTLLRKAAEKGGVHPLYLDRASSAYAVQIEQTGTAEAIPALMTEMFQGYCLLVRNYATRNYSAPVQKAVLYIDANLAENLTLHALAEKLNVSAGYLSTLFKRETGQTLTDYVNHRRVEHARHLLTTTRLQVQTIAQHCGIVDVQYFSKVFKRLTGKTPKAYRQNY